MYNKTQNYKKKFNQKKKPRKVGIFIGRNDYYCYYPLSLLVLLAHRVRTMMRETWRVHSSWHVINMYLYIVRHYVGNRERLCIVIAYRTRSVFRSINGALWWPTICLLLYDDIFEKIEKKIKYKLPIILPTCEAYRTIYTVMV